MSRVAHIYGKRLAAARAALALTQRQLGDLIGGVSDETISRIERHEVAGILAKRVAPLARALQIPLDEFQRTLLVNAPPALRTSKTGTQLVSETGTQLVSSNSSSPDALSPDAPSSDAPSPDALPIAERSALPGSLDLRRYRPARVVPEFAIGVAASRRVEKFADHPDANRLVAAADRRAFTIPVDGDCQHPKWKHGEIVIFSFDAAEREGILPGRSYYLAFVDGSTTFKRVFLDESDPEALILRCWNRKKYPQDQKVHKEEIARIARAISKQVAVDEQEKD